MRSAALLASRVTPGAAYDSAQHEYAPCCLPGTREGVLKTIRQWADKKACEHPIFWLTGPGGSGKSAIAHTFAEEHDAKKKLAGSFFFLRGDKFRSSVNDFFLTLAHQLTISVPSMQELLNKALVDNPSILSKTLEKQFNMLIYDPILALGKPIKPMIVVVDALDECENKDGVLKVVSIVSNAYRNPSFPLRFFFASRAYDYISGKFEDAATGPLTIRQNLQDWKASDDIRRYLRSEFQAMRNRRKRVMSQLPELWPTDSDLDLAVEKSEGLFIWASTVLRFVEQDRPQERLASALKLHPGLDALYRQVIEDAPRDDPFNSVIGTIPVLRIRFSVLHLSQFLGLEVDQIYVALQGLEPILDIPEKKNKKLQPYHASLHDFLTDCDRSKDFYINPGIQHLSIVLLCIKIFTDLKGGEVHRDVVNYASGNLVHHYKCALMQGDMNDSLLSQCLNIGQNWSNLACVVPFKVFFKSLKFSDGIFDTYRDLGAIVLKLEVSPSTGNIYFDCSLFCKF